MLNELRASYEEAHTAFKKLLESHFPGADKYTWFRALAHINGGIGRHNDDTSRDAALAADVSIQEAHDAYITRLHAFYSARDGSGGFLGGSRK